MKTSGKGGANVIWSKKQYIDETYRQLNDRQVYALLSCNTLKLMKTELKIAFSSALLNNWFTGKECDFLLPHSPTLVIFCLLCNTQTITETDLLLVSQLVALNQQSNT